MLWVCFSVSFCWRRRSVRTICDAYGELMVPRALSQGPHPHSHRAPQALVSRYVMGSRHDYAHVPPRVMSSCRACWKLQSSSQPC